MGNLTQREWEGEPLGGGALWQDRVHMGRIYRETELGAQRGTSTRPGAELPAAQVCKQNPDGSRSPRTRGWQFHLG